MPASSLTGHVLLQQSSSGPAQQAQQSAAKGVKAAGQDAGRKAQAAARSAGKPFLNARIAAQTLWRARLILQCLHTLTPSIASGMTRRVVCMLISWAVASKSELAISYHAHGAGRGASHAWLTHTGSCA